jgi:anti-sigma B factor antagonist
VQGDTVQGDGVPKRRVVTASGEIDLATAGQLRDRLIAAVLDADVDVVVDLSGVTFLDSTGLEVLVRTNSRLVSAGRRLVVRDPSQRVRRVLGVSGLDTVLRIEETGEGPTAARNGP